MSFSVSFAIDRRRYGPAGDDGRRVSADGALFPQFLAPRRGSWGQGGRGGDPWVYGSARMTKLVIIDDHEALREGLVALLSHGGLDIVGAAGNVAAGLDLVEHAEPDVAIVDIQLPDGTGLDLARQLLARHPGLGVILYTGDSDAERLYDGLDSGARGYALKAGSTDELLAAIELVAAGGSYVDPRLDRILLSPRATARVPQLSPREREIMHLMAEGMTADQIGDKITVSVETVRTHVRNVIRKLQARNRVHAIAIALERGEIALDPSAEER
jgi:DNA-binding NarL/FixJ family response regulator